MKIVPMLFENKNECCGCSACYAVCPENAIEMLEDEEGFAYPVINKEKCIKCWKCVRCCPCKEMDLEQK